MPRITFRETVLYKNVGPKVGVQFHENAVIDCTQEFADRWIKRGKAEVTGRGEPKSGERWTVIRGTVNGSFGQVEAPPTPESATETETVVVEKK